MQGYGERLEAPSKPTINAASAIGTMAQLCLTLHVIAAELMRRQRTNNEKEGREQVHC